ncbi:MAG: rhombosortase [Burkholderiales bacterium]|nr:rhombosortase [Burkholderiales bacterium]MDE2396554.1 rhombosortase [Burkholderiales bacterium]MDE2565428.1 rhombosortase [Burkholderiales bacterium]
MAGRLRLAGPGAAWLALAALFAVGALAGWTQPAARWDWQPGLAAAQPWRCWSAAFVHWSALHLAANLIGLAVVAAFGPVARLAPRCALAWFIAWPLTQLGLLLQPALLHYGGLSGVLHAGVAVAAVEMLVRERGRRRAIALAVLGGLLAKIALETPWGPPLRHPADWDIPIAPLAHASGACFGLFCGALAAWLPRRRG